MKTFRFSSILFAFAVMTIAGCQKDNKPDGPDNDNGNSKRSMMIDSTRTITPEQMAEEFAGNFFSIPDGGLYSLAFSLYGSRCRGSVSVSNPRFQTNSVTCRFGDVVLPGRVTWGVAAGKAIKPRYIFIESHWTISKAEDFPSRRITPIAALAKMDAIYICPDIPNDIYLNERLSGEYTLGFVRCVLDYLESEGMDLSGCKTYSIGYSQGGAAAVAVQKAIEADKALSDGLGFEASFAGGSPFDLESTFAYYSHSDLVPMPGSMILFARMADKYYYDPDVHPYSARQYLNPKLANLYDTILDGKLSLGQIDSEIASQIGVASFGNLFEKDPFAADSPLLAAAKDNNLLQGWVPGHMLFLFHSDDDQIVPYLNSFKAVGAFAGKATLKTGYGTHDESGAQFYIWLSTHEKFSK